MFTTTASYLQVIVSYRIAPLPPITSSRCTLADIPSESSGTITQAMEQCSLAYQNLFQRQQRSTGFGLPLVFAEGWTPRRISVLCSLRTILWTKFCAPHGVFVVLLGVAFRVLLVQCTFVLPRRYCPWHVFVLLRFIPPCLPSTRQLHVDQHTKKYLSPPEESYGTPFTTTTSSLRINFWRHDHLLHVQIRCTTCPSELYHTPVVPFSGGKIKLPCLLHIDLTSHSATRAIISSQRETLSLDVLLHAGYGPARSCPQALEQLL